MHKLSRGLHFLLFKVINLPKSFNKGRRQWLVKYRDDRDDRDDSDDSDDRDNKVDRNDRDNIVDRDDRDDNCNCYKY